MDSVYETMMSTPALTYETIPFTVRISFQFHCKWNRVFERMRDVLIQAEEYASSLNRDNLIFLPEIRCRLILAFELFGRNFAEYARVTFTPLDRPNPVQQMIDMCASLESMFLTAKVFLKEGSDLASIAEHAYAVTYSIYRKLQKIQAKERIVLWGSLSLFGDADFYQACIDAILIYNIHALYQADLAYAIFRFCGRDRNSEPKYWHAVDLYRENLNPVKLTDNHGNRTMILMSNTRRRMVGRFPTI